MMKFNKDYTKGLNAKITTINEIKYTLIKSNIKKYFDNILLLLKSL